MGGCSSSEGKMQIIIIKLTKVELMRNANLAVQAKKSQRKDEQKMANTNSLASLQIATVSTVLILGNFRG